MKTLVLSIGNLFNDYYSSITIELNNDIPTTNTDPYSCINYFSTYFYRVSADEFCKIEIN